MVLLLPGSAETSTPQEGVLESAGKEIKSTTGQPWVYQVNSEQRTSEISYEVDHKELMFT